MDALDVRCRAAAADDGGCRAAAQGDEPPARAAKPDEPAVEQLLADLDRAEAALAARVPPDATPRVGAAVAGDGRVYLDHARDIGAYNPCFPEYDIVVDGDRATGNVTFPIAYEGPPGHRPRRLPGAVLRLRQSNTTTAMSASPARPPRCRSATAVRLRCCAALAFDARTGRGRRSHPIVRAAAARRRCLLCEVEVDAIAGDRAALPEVSPRRSEP